MKLKICKVVDPATGFELASLGVHFLGFHVIDDTARSKRRRLAAVNRELRAAGYDIGVLLTKSLDHDWIVAAAEEGAYSLVQLHRSAEIGEVATLALRLKTVSARLIQVVDPTLRDQAYVDEALRHAAYVLFDNYVGGTGQQLSEELLGRFALDRAFVAGGIDEERAKVLSNGLRPFAIDVQSWVDILPSHKKKYGRVAALLQVIERSP